MQAWQLLGLKNSPLYPDNCTVAFHCAACGSPRVFHDTAKSTPKGELVCDEVCALSLCHSLHERIAIQLNWSLPEVRQFTLISLRDLLPPGKVKNEVTSAIRSGSHTAQP